VKAATVAPAASAPAGPQWRPQWRLRLPAGARNFQRHSRRPKCDGRTDRPPKPAAAPQKNAALQLLSGANAGKELDLTKRLRRSANRRPGGVITRRPQGFFHHAVEGASFPVVNGKTSTPRRTP